MFIPSLRNARISNDVVQADVAARLHAFSCKEESRAGHTLHCVSSFVKNQPFGAEPTFITEQEPKNYTKTERDTNHIKNISDKNKKTMIHQFIKKKKRERSVGDKHKRALKAFKHKRTGL